ncbi:hypothetical protein B7463_g7441, partial [Scytalidium lignicola]
MAFLLTAGLLISRVFAYDVTLGFNNTPEVETRSLNQIYHAALKEGGVVTLWHGGDETNQQDSLKAGFEKAFPGMQLNLTVDLSKYHDIKIDQQLRGNNVYVDSIVLQTLNDFPQWAQEGALLNYAPLGFDKIYNAFKDSVSAYWYGLLIFNWSFIWNTDKLPHLANITSFEDLLQPQFKNKLVLTYPNDDDAVLFSFNLIMQVHGTKWFDALLKQNPKWVRGTETPATILASSNFSQAVTFTSSVGLNVSSPLKIGFPTDAQFVSWSQIGGILKNAPHPNGAKLLHAYMLSTEHQSGGWSVRSDIEPKGLPYPDIMHMPNTNPTSFFNFMQDRANIERLRFYFEDRLGPPQGVSPLVDNLTPAPITIMTTVNVSLPVVHPFYPPSVTIPGVALNETPTPLLVAGFLSGWAAIVLAAFIAISYLKPSLRKVDKALVLCSTRYPIQAIVSVGQLYGNVLYLSTSLFDLYYNDISYCRPEGYYFWLYFFFFNFIWIVIPSFTVYQSIKETSKAFKELDKKLKNL